MSSEANDWLAKIEIFEIQIDFDFDFQSIVSSTR